MFNTFLQDEHGLETVEYAIIAGLIVASSVLVVTAIGGWVSSTYTSFQTEIGA